jgi:hypothetical protein
LIPAYQSLQFAVIETIKESEYDINDLRSDSPEMLSTPTAVIDKQNEVKKDNKPVEIPEKAKP